MSDTRSDQPRRFVIRHVSGSKVNQVEEFPFDQFDSLVFGRSATATVRFDPEHDELVSREHARITRDEGDPSRYSITDLGSRNGTFVNKVQVAGSASIRPGDTVQLGAGGPEFLFDLEPHAPGETRIAPALPAGKPTMVSSPSLTPDRATSGTAQDRPPQKVGVGRETVERLMVDAQRTTQKKTGWMLFAGGGVLLLLLALGIYSVNAANDRRSRDLGAAIDTVAAGDGTMTPADITRTHSEAVVFVETSWRLINADTDKPVLHSYEMVPFNGQTVPMAVYLRLPDGTVEPWITYSDPNGLNKPIRGAGTGTGFVISPDGFILTNKHVVSTWDYPYDFPADAFPGVMYTIGPDGQFVAQTDAQGNVVVDVLGNPVPRTDILQREQMPMWVPSQTKWVEQRPIENVAALKGEPEIRVTFQNSNIPFEAELERISPRADAATIKIDAQEPLHAVELHDTYDTAEVGQPVTIMGYPGISGFDVSTVQNREIMGQQSQARVVPRVTVTPANISSIARSRRTENPDERVVSLGFQDVFQLSTSETGHGNSGGPVFDDRGRVIGIFTYGINTPGDAGVTYAIPIKYGMELTRARGDL